MLTCNTFGKRPDRWGAQKPRASRAEANIDFTSLTRSSFTRSKSSLFAQPSYRKFTDTCGSSPGFGGPRRFVQQLRLRQLGPTIQTAFMERWYGTLRGLVAPLGSIR